MKTCVWVLETKTKFYDFPRLLQTLMLSSVINVGIKQLLFLTSPLCVEHQKHLLHGTCTSDISVWMSFCLFALILGSQTLSYLTFSSRRL